MQKIKKIVPFTPRHFPPALKHKSFSSLLQKADQALRAYAKELAEIPFPNALLEPLILLESMDSLDSQNIETTLEEVIVSHSAPFRCDDQLKPMMWHIRALKWACHQQTKTAIDKTLLCTLHRKIKNGGSRKDTIGGYRKQQNWIGPAGCNIEEAYFYPPSPEYVAPLMQQLLRYMKRKESEPLFQLALTFAQLLIIHPFMDGNGRVARIVIPLFLYQKKVIPIPFFFMSRYFKRHRFPYFFNLYRTTTENQWKSWIVFFLKGVRTQAIQMHRLIKEITKLYERIEQERIVGMTQKTLLFLFRKPVFFSSSFLQAKGTKSLLKALQHLKWVKKNKKGFFVFIPLVKILHHYLK